MGTFLISPFSAKLKSGKNPKDYPYWQNVVDEIHRRGHNIIQIGVEPEPRLEHTACLFNFPFPVLERLAAGVDVWLSIDNFFVHLATPIKPGIVLYGPSDPSIFGYKSNRNLFRSDKLFRKDQYGVWEGVPYDESNFVSPEEVCDTIKERYFNF